METSNRDTGSRLQESAIAVRELHGDWWRNPPAVELVSNEIHIWQFPLNVSESTLDGYTELLSADEKQRAGKFHFQRDNRRFTITRATMRSILGSYVQSGPSELQFQYSEHGKPRIKNPARDIRFNVSHSGEQAVIAVVSGRETGVDVEQIRDNIEIDSLAERFFSSTEKDFLRGLPQERKLSTFFRFWTCKEAFLKAQAVGLSRSLASFTVDLTTIPPSLMAATATRGEESQWSLSELACQTGYASALAVEGSIGAVQIFRQR